MCCVHLFRLYNGKCVFAMCFSSQVSTEPSPADEQQQISADSAGRIYRDPVIRQNAINLISIEAYRRARRFLIWHNHPAGFTQLRRYRRMVESEPDSKHNHSTYEFPGPFFRFRLATDSLWKWPQQKFRKNKIYYLSALCLSYFFLVAPLS